MPEFTAKILYADLRLITIEAETLDEARAKYDSGDWKDEHTLDFYALEETEALMPATPSLV